MTLHDTQAAAEDFAKTIDGAWGLLQIRKTASSPVQWIVIKTSPEHVKQLVKIGKLSIYWIGQSVCVLPPVAAPTKCCRCRAESDKLTARDTKTRFNGRSVDAVEYLCPACDRVQRVMAQG